MVTPTGKGDTEDGGPRASLGGRTAPKTVADEFIAVAQGWQEPGASNRHPELQVTRPFGYSLKVIGVDLDAVGPQSRP